LKVIKAIIIKKPNFQIVKYKSSFIWKMLSQAELETEGSRFATIFGSPATSQHRGYSHHIVIVVVCESLLIQLNPEPRISVSRPWREPQRRYKSESRRIEQSKTTFVLSKPSSSSFSSGCEDPT